MFKIKKFLGTKIIKEVTKTKRKKKIKKVNGKWENFKL